jgi:small subunit ribosomal protein S6
MTRTYEAVYIFDSTLEDTAIGEKLAKFNALLGKAEGLTADHWGRRQLAYAINKRETGYYIVSRFTVEPGVLPEFERALKLDEGVLRYLITIYEHELGAPANAVADGDFVGKRRDDDDDDEE